MGVPDTGAWMGLSRLGGNWQRGIYLLHFAGVGFPTTFVGRDSGAIMRWITVAMLGLAVVAADIGCKQKPSETGDVVIGEFASMSGGTASFGQASHRGLELAIEQANSAGGVLGRHISLKMYDDRSNVEEAVNVVQKLISEDHVVAVIGEVASKRSIAGATVCEHNKIPMLSPASTNPAVTVENGQTLPWIFRICFIDDFQGKADARFAVEQGWKHVAMLTNEEEDYAKGLGRFFKQGFAGHGEIGPEVSYNNSTKDFASQIKRIADAKPDAVYVPGYYEELGLILKAASDANLKVPFFGGDGWDSPQTLKMAEAQGDYYTDHFTAQDPSPRVQEFVAAFKQKYNGETPDAMDVLGYDAGKVLIDAIKRAGKTDPEAIRDALASTKDFPGASGTITIDAQHNARKPIVMLQIKDQKAQLVKTYTPEELDPK
jgi:branched-chain amino acid transport system substrate-binding protein